MAKIPALKNILFDLGGVILDLDVNGTLEAFLNLGFQKELLNYPENLYTDVFFNYETGRVNTEEFRDSVRKLSGIDFGDKEFDAAWCKMLGRIPRKRTEILQSLSKEYNLYVLSNTSPMHIKRFTEMFYAAGGYLPEEVFTKMFYSHDIGLHKPDPAAFQHVIHEANILPGETLFLDDNIHNVKSARELGFSVIHITDNLRMENVGFNQ